ncbi:MAG: MFS transporter, partial [Fibrobacteraceae bacterium]|nr:MFS transporter [Fibrobacteraceae bacterium]
MLRTKGSIPYLLFVFASSFLQMGLFLFIEQWLKFSYRGDDFLIDSAFLQAMFFLPYILLFPFAGYLANKFDKVKVIAWTSVGAFFITAAFAFLWGLCLCDAAIWLVIPLSSLFALNSPAKYGLLKEMYGKSRLVHSNAYLQSAIVLAAILSTIVMMGFYGEREMSFQMCYLPWSFAAISFFAAVAAFCIPVSGFSCPSMKMRTPARIFRSTWNTMLFRLCIVGLSLFWGIAQVFVLLSQDFSGESMLTLMQKGLFFSGLGMILGAYVASRFSHSFIETGFIPISVLGGSVGMLFITFFSSPLVLSILYAWLGFCFGAFGVIMNALLQENTKPDTSGRILAVANMVEMTLLIAFIGVQAVLLNFTNIDKETFFFILAIFLLASFVWAFIKLPQSLLRTVLRMFFAFRYRLKIKGNNNIPAEGPVLLMGNHSSYIDWAILQMTSPRSIRMASNADRYESNFLKWILTLLGVIRINRRDPAPAMWAIRKALLAGEAVVIFPEGELSKSSNISRFSIDYSEAIQGTNAKIIPFYIQGLWGGRYSYANESVCFGESLTRIVTIAFGKDVPAATSPQVLRNTLRELSMEAWNTSISFYPTLAPLWLKATKKLVGSKISIYSPLGNHISGFKLIQNVLIHSKKFRVIAHKEQNVGFMFPPSPEGVSTLLSIWVAGKTSVNLNYTSGIETVIKCIERADVKTVFTSWAFLDKLQKRGQNYFQLGSVCKLICVEDVDKLISPISRVAAWLASVTFPAGLIEFCYFKRVKREDTAVVLFSSGSEGTPKGVMLSHKNLVANVQQANAIFTIRPYDVMLAELPIFHSFGLTATVLMSLFEGIPMVTCAEPTDVKTMARVCAEFK